MKGLYKAINRICKRLNILVFFKTSKGIKSFNAKPFRCRVPAISDEILEFSSSDVFLGVDYLVDHYTLLDVNIASSPHFYFMQCLEADGDLTTTDYIIRTQGGYLDGRYSVPSGKTDYYHKVYKINKEMILSGDYEPIYVYEYKGRLYIYDGKHRAALCSFLDKPIKCKMVDANLALGICDAIVSLMKKDESKFSKHLVFFDDILD